MRGSSSSDPVAHAKRLEAQAEKRRAEIRAYNREVMPSAGKFMSEVVAAAEKNFGKVRVDMIKCDGYIWERGQNNDKAKRTQ